MKLKFETGSKINTVIVVREYMQAEKHRGIIS